MLSATWDEAVAEITTPARSHSNNHLLASAEGRAVDFEAAPGDIFTVEPRDGILVHSNHFIATDNRAQAINRDEAGSTRQRLNRVTKALEARAPSISVRDIQHALQDHSDHDKSVCVHPVPNSQTPKGTIASTVMDLNTLTLFIAPGLPCEHKYTEYKFS